jgi:hypothetical protein
MRMPLARSVTAAAKGDAEGALESFCFAVYDVGEDADLGGLVDEVCVLDVVQRNHGAGVFADDVADHVKSMVGAVVQGDNSDVGQFIRGQDSDHADVGDFGDDRVPERDDQLVTWSRRSLRSSAMRTRRWPGC